MPESELSAYMLISNGAFTVLTERGRQLDGLSGDINVAHPPNELVLVRPIIASAVVAFLHPLRR